MAVARAAVGREEAASAVLVARVAVGREVAATAVLAARAAVGREVLAATAAVSVVARVAAVGGGMAYSNSTSTTRRRLR